MLIGGNQVEMEDDARQRQNGIFEIAPKTKGRSSKCLAGN